MQLFCPMCSSDYYPEHGCFCVRIKLPSEALLSPPGVMEAVFHHREDDHLGAVSD